VGTGPGQVRSAGVPAPLPVTIRLEAPGDEPGVRAVELAAFTGPEEADIVDRIRLEAPDGWRSLVAADADGRVVGHLLLSPCVVTDADGIVVGRVLALGPMAVLPRVQFRGVGSSLITAAMGLAIARAVPALVLLGYPAYYPRFGFAPARAQGLLPPANAWPDEAWMARLLPAWTDDMRGTVRYPEAFEPLA
jgi:putative acetyltransferase